MDGVMGLVQSELERALLTQCRQLSLPEPVLEHRFHPTRRWRFDLAWPDHKLAAECEGGVYSKGRHVRGKGFTADCDKYNAAALLGWRVLRFTRYHIDTGKAVALIEKGLHEG